MGTLYLVATPIGNLEDITLRALRVLRGVPLIAAEDTRHTRKLLTHFEIATPTISYHQHSGSERVSDLLQALATGDVALVTDAGTPGISDPGAELVRVALAAGHEVVPIPGPVAAIAALIASGLPTDQFTVLGFLPRRPADRRDALAAIRSAPQTLVLYEAPHRLRATLDDLLTVLGDRHAAIARELTKVHEQWLRGTLSQLREISTETAPRGEYSIVVEGATSRSEPEPVATAQTKEERAVERLRELMGQGMRTREAASETARELGLSRRDTYALALTLRDNGASEE